MKSKKVFLGLILAAFVGSAGFATAQIKANYHNNLIEIGPDNIGGRVRALAFDNSKAFDTVDVLYAGGVAGGLYKRLSNGSWDYVPCYLNGKEVTLPISFMVQTPNDNNIIIATGEGLSVGEHANKAMIIPQGRGLYRFNPAAAQDAMFTLIPNTDPATHADWTYINKMAYLYRDNSLYFYVATNGGLFRWKINSASDWNSAPEKVFSGAVQDVEIVSNDNMAFFTSGSRLYKIGNVTAQGTYADISATNSAFGGTATRIELAAAHSDKTYLYALVTDDEGLCKGIFLTNDQQTWITLASPTVTPFDLDNPGWHNSAITVDPQNHKRIYVGGASVWIGEGYVEGSYYQWNKASYSESELNAGNYMGQCYSDTLFCHSGIHEILPVDLSNDGIYSYYIATDGGVYKAGFKCGSFRPINKGFNTVQFNEFAVSPDGSIIGGAIDNSCPFIQSRNGHYGGDADTTWYTNFEYDLDSNRNTIGNILWFGNGGQTAASKFQRLLPNPRRGIFTSSNGGDFFFTGNQGTQQAANFGRACNDYSDYTNTQTWTIGDAFVEDVIAEAHEVPHMVLWETTQNVASDVVTFTLDTLGIIYRRDTALYISSVANFKADTIGYIMNGNEKSYVIDANRFRSAMQFKIKAGDRYVANSRAHFNYPFDYFFANNRTIFDTTYRTHTSEGVELVDTVHSILSVTTQSPIASRMFINGKNGKGLGVINMTMAPNDYSKVWTLADAGNFSRTMHWFNIYKCTNGWQPGVMATSLDCNDLYVALANDSLNQHLLVRITNIMDADAANLETANAQLTYQPDYEGMPRITRFDTIKYNGSVIFDRPITSISVDPRANVNAIVVTFGGEGEGANVLYIANVNDSATRTITAKNVLGGTEPVYSSVILAVDPSDAAHQSLEGSILVGTARGVFQQNSGASSWTEFGAFDGVPVTAIHQQVDNLEEQKYIGHTGINAEQYIFARTKFPYAVYFGTYGRGIFMDCSLVVDKTNDVIADEDYELLDIPQVESLGENSISIYPNPVSEYANVNLDVCNAGHAVMKVYDLTGKLVMSEDLGTVEAGTHSIRVNCQGLRHGMYLVNVSFGTSTASAKIIVR